MIQKQIVVQPGLTPNRHFNCSALLKQMRWYTTGSTKHTASETDYMLGKSLCTVSVDAFLCQPSLHHSELQLWPASSKCTACNTSDQPWPLPSYHPSQVFGKTLHTSQPAAEQQPTSKMGSSVYMCTAYPAQHRQSKTCLWVSPARLAKSHMPSQNTQLIWRR